VDNKQIRSLMANKIKEINSRMGKESSFPRATETYRNYSQELRDSSYSNQTLKQLESGFLKDFENDYMNDMFPKEVKKEFERKNNEARAKGADAKMSSDKKYNKPPLSKGK
jgi:hypothetical protein